MLANQKPSRQMWRCIEGKRDDFKITRINSKLDNNENWPEVARQTGWSASALAEYCGVCLRTLERHLLKQTGKSPRAWLAAQRQCQAMVLLRSGLSVKETAAYLGYKYAQHFTREFKRYWGFCPTALRAQPAPPAGRRRVLK